MKKHFTKLIVALLALAMLLPIVVQAAPTDGWTDEAEQAYQTLTEKAIQQVTESRDYLSLPIQQRNTRAVYALWTAGAVVPEGFYDAYLQSLAGWLDMAAQNGRCAYIPTAIRTVAAMGLDVTDFAGHDLLDPLRKPDMMTADEDRLNMLLDLSCAGEAGETKEFAALREQLLTEAMARQQSSGQFRYSTIPGTELRFTSAYDGNALFIWLRDKGVIKDPDRFEYILLTAQSVQALAPYQDRKDVSAAIDKALNYLSAQQLPSGGFARFGEENVEEDAAVLEMLAVLGISLTDERFTKDGCTILDGMMGWYQAEYLEEVENEPKQGFYYYNRTTYNEETQTWERLPCSPEAEAVMYQHRRYRNDEAYRGLSALRALTDLDKAPLPTVTMPEAGSTEQVSIDYASILGEKLAESKERTDLDAMGANWYWSGSGTIITWNSLSRFSEEVLAREKIAGGKLSEDEKAELRDLMEKMTGANSEYLMGRTSAMFVPGIVRALKAIDADPGDFYGLDYLAPLTSMGKMDQLDYAKALQDFDAVDESVWRSRGVDVDTMVDKYAEKILSYQMSNGRFYWYYGAGKYYAADAEEKEALGINGKANIEFITESLKALGPHQDKAYIAEAVEKGLNYLSSIQEPDGTFGNLQYTLAVADMMEALNIPLDDERFVKNGYTLEDAVRTFYVDGIGFVNRNAELSAEDICGRPRITAAPTRSTCRESFALWERAFQRIRKPHNIGFPWRSRTATPMPDIFSTAWSGRRTCRRPTFCCLPHVYCTTWATSSGTTHRSPQRPRESRLTANAYNACGKRRWQWAINGTTAKTSRAMAWAACKRRIFCAAENNKKIISKR